MSAKGNRKTPEYTKRAVDNYRSNHDFINLTIDLGEKQKWLDVGIDNKAIIEIVRAEYEKRCQKA